MGSSAESFKLHIDVPFIARRDRARSYADTAGDSRAATVAGDAIVGIWSSRPQARAPIPGGLDVDRGVPRHAWDMPPSPGRLVRRESSQPRAESAAKLHPLTPPPARSGSGHDGASLFVGSPGSHLGRCSCQFRRPIREPDRRSTIRLHRATAGRGLPPTALR